MANKEALARADKALRLSLDETTRLISLRDKGGKRALKRLLRTLEDADLALGLRLRKKALKYGPTKRFTAASAEAYRLQNKIVAKYVRARLLGLTEEQALVAITKSARSSVRLLGELEGLFSGVVRPIRLANAVALDPLIQRTAASLLAQHASSVDRYGTAIIADMERTMRAGLLSGASNRDMVQALTGHAGGAASNLGVSLIDGGLGLKLTEKIVAKGVFTGRKAWAERIVRTETAHASQAAALETYSEVQQTIFPDMGKKIMAHFDNRTAADSVAVHGQIRAIDDFFVDGKGRRYVRPPGRPNDRETLVPWRASWPETAITRPKNADEVAAAIQKSVSGGREARKQSRAQRATARKQAAARARAQKQALSQP